MFRFFKHPPLASLYSNEKVKRSFRKTFVTAVGLAFFRYCMEKDDFTTLDRRHLTSNTKLQKVCDSKGWSFADIENVYLNNEHVGPFKGPVVFDVNGFPETLRPLFFYANYNK
jgi:hypothetical protein